MKYGDIQKLRESGFITDEQRQKIVEHFKLELYTTRQRRLGVLCALAERGGLYASCLRRGKFFPRRTTADAESVDGRCQVC